MSKTVSIPEDLGCQCAEELVAADVASLMRRVDFIEKLSAALGSLSGVMAFPGPTPPRDPSVDFGVFPLNAVNMNFMLS
jgi:hypothetical protein